MAKGKRSNKVMEFNRRFGAALRGIREGRGMTQDAVREKMGFGRRETVSEIEAGRRSVMAIELEDYAKALGVDIRRLVDCVSDAMQP